MKASRLIYPPEVTVERKDFLLTARTIEQKQLRMGPDASSYRASLLHAVEIFTKK